MSYEFCNKDVITRDSIARIIYWKLSGYDWNSACNHMECFAKGEFHDSPDYKQALRFYGVADAILKLTAPAPSPQEIAHD